MAHKRAIALALLLSALAVASAHAAVTMTPADPHRRTLYVTIGEDTVRFEAPEGMCFADRTRREEAALYTMVEQSLRLKGDENLLGFFMSCDSLANPGHPLAREGRVPSFGLITYPHKIEDSAPVQSPAAYLDWRAASFHEYVAVNLTGWLLAADPLRQPGDSSHVPELAPGPAQGQSGLFTTFSQYVSADAQPYPTTGAAGTTLLRGHPVEFIMRLNKASGIHDEMGAHTFMVNFLDLQAAINR